MFSPVDLIDVIVFSILSVVPFVYGRYACAMGFCSGFYVLSLVGLNAFFMLSGNLFWNSADYKIFIFPLLVFMIE